MLFSRRRFLQMLGASAGVAVTGNQLLAQAVAGASPSLRPGGSGGVEHVVVLMMENRSFDHMLSWLPGADGRSDLTFLSTDGNRYPNYPLAPDFQGCGYSDPDHSWEGFLVETNFGRMDGFLQRPTTPGGLAGVTPAAANTFPVGYYTNRDPHGRPKPLPDLPVTGALAEAYTVLDRYFCSFAGETFPNRFYQHAATTDRDHNSETDSVLPTIWDQLSPVANTDGIPTGGYYYRDSPFLALWGISTLQFKYQAFFHPFSAADASTAALSAGTSFVDACANGTLPNVSFIDPAFDDEGNGTSADNHPLADIRLGERFIADAYHALADNGLLDNTVLVITYDEWGGFYDHVPPPHVVDDTNPANVDHTGDTGTVDGHSVPDYTQLGVRVPAIVVTNLAEPGRVLHDGPFEHCSTLALIESTFGLKPLTARDAHARNLRGVLSPFVGGRRVDPARIPTSADVIGPAISPPAETLATVLAGTAENDPAAICSATSVQSVSPEPVGFERREVHAESMGLPALPTAIIGTAGMAAFARHRRQMHAAKAALEAEVEVAEGGGGGPGLAGGGGSGPAGGGGSGPGPAGGGGSGPGPAGGGGSAV